jgi:hypothetical protein
MNLVCLGGEGRVALVSSPRSERKRLSLTASRLVGEDRRCFIHGLALVNAAGWILSWPAAIVLVR